MFNAGSPEGLHYTFCTARRRPSFVDAVVVDMALEQILRCAELFGFAVIAFCFMPDRVHLLIEACSEGADWIADGGPLWQPSYYDHVLRNDDATLSVARYILENPVRRGFAKAPADYAFSGSARYTLDQILEAVYWQP